MGLPPGLAVRISTRKLSTRKLQGVKEEAGEGQVRGWKDLFLCPVQSAHGGGVEGRRRRREHGLAGP